MTYALKVGKNAPLPGKINSFVDGAAVRQVGKKGFELTRNNKIPIYPVQE